MASKLVRIEAPITGVFGEEVQVGDPVMIVTTGYSHRVSVTKGKYLGYIEGSGYYSPRAQVAVESKRTIQMKPDGTEFNWGKDYHKDTWHEVSKTLTRKEVDYTYITTLKLNRIATLKA
jgi:hypothetical protein